jgi:hypothetical protein
MSFYIAYEYIGFYVMVQAQQQFHVTNGDSVQYMSSSMGSGLMSAASNFNTSYRMQQQPGTNSSGSRNNSVGGQGQFFYYTAAAPNSSPPTIYSPR